MLKAVATALFLLFAAAAAAQSITLEPRYEVAGKNPNGSGYSGTISLAPLSNTTFAVRWNIGGSIYTGFGMRMNNMLSATYTINGRPGLVMYQLEAGGRLSGIWAVRGINGNGSEVLTPLK